MARLGSVLVHPLRTPSCVSVREKGGAVRMYSTTVMCTCCHSYLRGQSFPWMTRGELLDVVVVVAAALPLLFL